MTIDIIIFYCNYFLCKYYYFLNYNYKSQEILQVTNVSKAIIWYISIKFSMPNLQVNWNHQASHTIFKLHSYKKINWHNVINSSIFPNTRATTFCQVSYYQRFPTCTDWISCLSFKLFYMTIRVSFLFRWRWYYYCSQNFSWISFYVLYFLLLIIPNNWISLPTDTISNYWNFVEFMPFVLVLLGYLITNCGALLLSKQITSV